MYRSRTKNTSFTFRHTKEILRSLHDDYERNDEAIQKA